MKIKSSRRQKLYMCEKEGREERKDIFEEYVLKEKKKRSLIDIMQSCLIYVCIAYMYCDWYETCPRKEQTSRFFYS